MIQNTAEELAWLVQETERLVRNVEDIRVRIASGKRRASASSHDLRGGSGEGEGAEVRESATELSRVTPTTIERVPCSPASDRPSAPGSDRAPAHVSLARWLPPLSPPNKKASDHDSDVYPVVNDARPAILPARRTGAHPAAAQSGSHAVTAHAAEGDDLHAAHIKPKLIG